MSSLSSLPLSSSARWVATLSPGSVPHSCSAPRPVAADAPKLYTVRQFAECEPAFTPSALRNLIFKAQPRHSSKGVVPGNGLLEAGAIVRVQRKVLIHRERFLAWVQQ